MKIFVTHPSSIQYIEDLYRPIRDSQLNDQHIFILPQEDGREVVTRDIIRECDLILAEVSKPSTGQGIELGWADLFERPIICMYKEGANPSSSLAMVSKKMLMYTSPENMIEDITGVLKEYE